MNLDDVKRRGGRRRTRKRVGRGPGSGAGKTSSRGQKGQKSRSGYSRRALFEGGQMPLVRRLPKKGFNNKWRVEYEVLNLDQLESRFEEGSLVDPEAIRHAGLIKKRDVRIKILARGDLTKKLEIKAHRFSREAKRKIEEAGGSAGSI